MSNIVRLPFQANRFYPADYDKCLNQVKECTSESLVQIVPDNILGGIVPHAGWTYSGSLAGLVFKTIKDHVIPETFIIFGAVHYAGIERPVIYDQGMWKTPIGSLLIDEELAKIISDACLDRVLVSKEAHDLEHSIEVQLPFIKYLFPNAKILPILMPPIADAVNVGVLIAKVVERYSKKTIVIGSTDLTHYGKQYYGFAPAGIGRQALEWSKNNDWKVLKLIVELKAEEILRETAVNHNACGPGAISATVSAVRELGADKGYLLKHTTSSEIKSDIVATDFVGYGAVVF